MLRNESGNQFSRKQNFLTEFGQKTNDMNWCVLPRTTSLFITEIYGQLG